MIDEGLVKIGDEYVFILNEEIKLGDWTYSSHSKNLVYVGSKGHAELGNELRIRDNSYVRKVIGHTGVEKLAGTNLVLFSMYGDEDCPHINILKR